MPKDVKATLTNWFFLPTLEGGVRVVGKVTGNPNFPDGLVIQTSGVVKVLTATESEYTLEGPSQGRIN